MNRNVRIVVAALVAVAIAAGAFTAGAVFGSANPLVDPVSPVASLVAGAAPKDRMQQAVEETRRLIEKEALKPSSEESLTRGAIEGMLDSLDDKYAMYFDTTHFKAFSEQTSGEFFGIGVTISDKDGRVFIIETIKNTPAQRAGLKAGDEFITVDGASLKKWTTEEVSKKVRGPEGTTVKLQIRRKGEKGLRNFTIKRAKINYPNIMSELLGKDVGYMRLGQFNGHSAQEISDSVAELEKKGAKGFILDLRENPGGLLDQAVAVTSLFVKEGAVVRIDARGKPEDVQNVTGSTITDKPLVVLVDENSASASEIVAAALQDHRRAKIVGATTFGKGSVQNMQDLSFGGAIKLTIARYLSPNGRVIDGKGVKPDNVVKMKPEDQQPREKDIQLKRALEVLRASF